MARTITPRRAAVSQKRVIQWIGSADQGYTAVAAGANVIQQNGATLGNTTITRVRGGWSVQPQTYAADLNLIGVIGFGLVSDQAFTAGAASIPGLWTDPDWGGWFLWLPFQYRYEVTTDVGRLVLGGPGQGGGELDSKAMRKVAPNETLVVMVESQAVALNVSINFRMLVKLA